MTACSNVGEVDIPVPGFAEQITVNTQVGCPFWGMWVVCSKKGKFPLGRYARNALAVKGEGPEIADGFWEGLRVLGRAFRLF